MYNNKCQRIPFAVVLRNSQMTNKPRMKKLLFILTLIVCFNSYSQTSFEKGYYISETNQRIDGFIKNLDWKNNPTTFEFKSSEKGNPEVLTIESVKEFGIDMVSKYNRHLVNMDRSSDLVSQLGTDKAPILKEEQLFLKVLVEGKANLFLYEDGNVVRYFYSKDSLDIEQLIYKRYLTPERKIALNKTYTQQLWNQLKCPTISFSNVENINYKQKELVNFFLKYNECNNSVSTNFQTEKKADLFNLSLRAGLNSSSFSVEYNRFETNRGADFGQKLGFRAGVELEFILPFNNGKWGLILEPTYQYFKASTPMSSQTTSWEASIDYTSIEVPLGLRHYFFLNENAKIFVNAAVIFDFTENSTLSDVIPRGEVWPINSSSNFAMGAGLKYHNLSLEFRYHTSRGLMNTYTYWTSDYKTMSVILGYTIF